MLREHEAHAWQGAGRGSPSWCACKGTRPSLWQGDVVRPCSVSRPARAAWLPSMTMRCGLAQDPARAAPSVFTAQAHCKPRPQPRPSPRCPPAGISTPGLLSSEPSSTTFADVSCRELTGRTGSYGYMVRWFTHTMLVLRLRPMPRKHAARLLTRRQGHGPGRRCWPDRDVEDMHAALALSLTAPMPCRVAGHMVAGCGADRRATCTTPSRPLRCCAASSTTPPVTSSPWACACEAPGGACQSEACPTSKLGTRVHEPCMSPAAQPCPLHQLLSGVLLAPPLPWAGTACSAATSRRCTSC